MRIRGTHITAAAITLCVASAAGILHAQVMGSTNYAISHDSINVGGGDSTSTNYTVESTAGENATGESNSATYYIHSGYQQMHEVYLSLTGAQNVTLDTAIGGLTGGTSNGSTTVTVITDSAAGYQLTIKATNDPAMQQGANTIADYTPGGAVPDFAFATTAGAASFGYTVEGADTAQRFLDNGSNTCGTGSTDSALSCWDGLSTVATTIASGNAANQPNGATTSIRFRVGVGANANLTPGDYYATTTITALPL